MSKFRCAASWRHRRGRACASWSGANLSGAERHRDRRIPGRRACRHHRAPGFDQARSKAQAQRRGGESRRRRRQHRGQGRAGSAPDGYTLLATTTGLAANITASKSKGFEQGDLRPIAIVAIQPRRHRRAPEQSGQDPEGISRQRQGQELHLRQRRRRHRPADRRGVFLLRGRQGEIRPRAVPGRRAGDHRDARQSR